MKYLGDYAEDATVDFKFSTHQSDGTPITLAGTPAVSVYKANGTTESTAGVTLTVDFDSRTGCHHVRIDTSADAYYAVSNDYQVVITTGTVDGTSVVGTVIGVFSVENRNTEATLADGAHGGASATITADITGDLSGSVGSLTGHTVQTGDTYALANGVAGFVAIDTVVDDILVDTGTTLDAHLTDIKGTGFVKDTHSLVDIEAYVDLIDDGTSGLAKIATDVAEVLVDTGTTIPATLSALNDVSAAEVNAEVVDALATDTYAEPAQGTPAATTSLAVKLGYLYKAWRNKNDQDATTYQLYNDDASTVDHKATCSSDGTTTTKGEVTTGP